MQRVLDDIHTDKLTNAAAPPQIPASTTAHDSEHTSPNRRRASPPYSRHKAKGNNRLTECQKTRSGGLRT
jgi:hypothetical protein